MPPGAVETANKSCHTCRRNRWRCDRTLPHCRKCTARGRQCLGYGQFFMWTGAVASRGKLAGQSSSAALYRDGQADPSSAVVKRNNNSPEKDDIDIEVFDAPDMQLVRSNSGIDPGMADIWALADPLYQDMSKSHRFYLSYFSSRVCLDLVANDMPDVNPFRYLLSLTQTHPLMLHVLVAAAAAHLANMKRPLINYSPTSAKRPTDDSLKDALIAKHRALQLMPAALENIESVGSDMVLAAVLFLINVELIESGRHGWRPHLLGACRIMSLIQPTTVLNQTLRDYIFSDCFVYYVLASAFMPSAAEMPMSFQSSRVLAALQKTAANSYYCCPPELLEILLLASRLANERTDEPASIEKAMTTGAALLERVESVDIEAWAHRVHDISSLRFVDVGSRRQAAMTHKLAACLYTLQVVPELENNMPIGSKEELINDFFYHLAQTPEEDPNFKASAWPTFIAGAAASKPDQRAWAMARLQRLVVIVPWGFIYTAMDIMHHVWKRDPDGTSKKSWVQTLKDPNLNFLIV